ncbi:BatA domain-containing protein [Undibacterium flavidum]|uniref:Aerotolerance regulator N-terminal domain-containing protein n=1 Tax=Undibacterium flavidum TaxID=2762297 RepID=A0ABR6YFI0_9BURK|nr:BatA domain-containing protein [Undibacterium flavidum]MBC3875239.1 hypothetical protein [Undibacterium flavidum]
MSLSSLMGLSPYWWLLVPIVGLPIWWHRQRRQTQKMHTLATAKFLPSTPPQLLRVWRWRDLLLLLLRCLMLMTMLAILAQPLWSWRGDTVFVGEDLDPQWVAAEIDKAGFKQAPQIQYCATAKCEIQTDHLLLWLEQEQTQWQPQARWLILAQDQQLAMSARVPAVGHTIAVRIAPLALGQGSDKTSSPTSGQTSSKKSANKQILQVALQTDRADLWRRIFKLFELAGVENLQFNLTEKIQPNTWLAIWDKQVEPDQNWQAPFVWRTAKSAQAPAKLNVSSDNNSTDKLSSALLQKLHIQSQTSTRGLIWNMDPQFDWPLQDADLEQAKALFEALQAVRAESQIVPLSTLAALDLPANKVKASIPLAASVTDHLREILFALLALLLTLERSLAHVRRS